MSLLIQNIWREASEALRASVGDKVYGLWFARTRLLSIQRGTAVIGVPNVFAKEWLESRNRDRVAAALGAALRSPVSVEFRVDGALYRSIREAEARELRDETAPRPPADPEARFSLDQFIPDEGCRLAFEAVHAFIAGPDRKWSPLVIYGPTGAGKTHLLRGAALALNRRTSMPVRRIEGLHFRHEILASLRRREAPALKRRFLSAPALLVDEVHRIGTTPGILGALGSLLKALVDSGRPVLLTSRHQPAAIHHLDASLRSLLLSGLVIQIEPPRSETMKALLSRTSLEFARPVEPAALDVLVEHVGGSVAGLQSALRRVVAYAALCGAEPSASFFREHVPELLEREPVSSVVSRVLEGVERRFSVLASEILSARRHRRLAVPRAVAAYVLHRAAGQSIPVLTGLFSGRRRAAVRNLVRRAERAMLADPSLKECVESLCRDARTGS